MGHRETGVLGASTVARGHDPATIRHGAARVTQPSEDQAHSEGSMHRSTPLFFFA